MFKKIVKNTLEKIQKIKCSLSSAKQMVFVVIVVLGV
jgi:hypothetical protein